MGVRYLQGAGYLPNRRGSVIELPWKEYVRVFTPLIVLLGVNVLLGVGTAIYGMGFREGQRRIMYAAAVSATEAKSG
jgi:hypothetical protein